MGIISIVALVICGLLWLAAVVEFTRTLSELNRCRDKANRLMSGFAPARKLGMTPSGPA